MVRFDICASSVCKVQKCCVHVHACMYVYVIRI